MAMKSRGHRNSFTGGATGRHGDKKGLHRKFRNWWLSRSKSSVLLEGGDVDDPRQKIMDGRLQSDNPYFHLEATNTNIRITGNSDDASDRGGFDFSDAAAALSPSTTATTSTSIEKIMKRFLVEERVHQDDHNTYSDDHSMPDSIESLDSLAHTYAEEEEDEDDILERTILSVPSRGVEEITDRDPFTVHVDFLRVQTQPLEVDLVCNDSSGA